MIYIITFILTISLIAALFTAYIIGNEDPHTEVKNKYKYAFILSAISISLCIVILTLHNW